MKLYTLFFLLVTISSQVFSQGFENKAFLVLSDSDIEVHSGIDTNDKIVFPGDLPQDQLIRITPSPEGYTYSQQSAQNSALNWNKSFALSKDSNLVIVAQTHLGIELDSKPTTPHQLVAYHPQTLKPTDSISIGPNPYAVAIHPAGEFVATVVDSVGSEIALTSLRDGKFGQTFYFPTGVQTSIRIRATDIAWHPSGQYLAITLQETGMVAFYKLSLLGTRPVVQMNNNPLKIGKLPSAGQFSPDGKHYLIMDLDGRTKPGRLLAIRCDFKQGGKHGLTAYLPVGINSSSFSISPDGKRILVINKGSKSLPQQPSDKQQPASLQFIERDPVSGKLKNLHQLDYDGLSPGFVQFSQDQNTVAVLTFQQKRTEEGAIDFFSIENNQLVLKSENRIPVPKGAHAMIILATD